MLIQNLYNFVGDIEICNQESVLGFISGIYQSHSLADKLV